MVDDAVAAVEIDRSPPPAGCARVTVDLSVQGYPRRPPGIINCADALGTWHRRPSTMEVVDGTLETSARDADDRRRAVDAAVAVDDFDVRIGSGEIMTPTDTLGHHRRVPGARGPSAFDDAHAHEVEGVAYEMRSGA